MTSAADIVSYGRDRISEIANDFWNAATEPLKHLTVQTGILLALVVLVAWLVARIIRSATWRFSRPVTEGLEVVSTYHTNSGTIALSPEDYIRKFASDPSRILTDYSSQVARQKWGAEKDKKVRSQYFVVTIVERALNAPRWLGTPVLTRELRVWRKTNPPRDGYLQLDKDCLREVRDHNNSSADDIEGSAIEGRYDLYMRRVRWFDVRHWLVHPNREIRIALWVNYLDDRAGFV